MKYTLKVLIYFSLIYITSDLNNLHAQGCCSGGVSLGNNLGLSAGNKHQLQIQYTHNYNKLNTLMFEDEKSEGNNSAGNNPYGGGGISNTSFREVYSNLLEINYGLLDKLTVTGVLSWVQLNRIAPENTEVFKGWGDFMFLAKYKVLETGKKPGTNTALSIGLGPKIPVASTEHKTKNDLKPSLSDQPGSGTWDGIYWIYFYQRNLIKDHINFTLISNYRATSTNYEYLNNFAWKLGDEYRVSFGFSEQLLIGDLIITPSAMFRYNRSFADLSGSTFNKKNKDPGFKINSVLPNPVRKTFNMKRDVDLRKRPSTGGIRFYFIPGLAVKPTQNLRLSVNGSIPVYRYMNGSQVATTFQLTGSVYYNFDFSTSKSPVIDELK